MLVHFSSSVTDLDSSRQYQQETGMKPSGLWYSVEGNGDGWKQWCKSEEFNLRGLKYAHRIRLNRSGILHLSSSEDVVSFAENFKPVLATRLNGCLIEWKRVASQYKGIEISPYLWKLRLADGFLWYCGWDCASGCIWDFSCVKSFDLIESTL